MICRAALTSLNHILALLITLLAKIAYAQSTTVATESSSTFTATASGTVPTPTAATGDPAAPPPVDLNDTTGWSVVIIDKQWTQLFIGGLPIVAGAVVLGSLYQFLWVPWWIRKMKQVEKEYERLEKQRMGGTAGRA